MKNLYLFIATLVISLSCEAEQLIDFSNDRHDVSYWSECLPLNPCSLAFQQNPSTGKQALLASWDAMATSVMDIQEKAPEYLTAFSAVSVTADITVIESTHVRDCQLLLKDKAGETYYFSHPVDWTKPGHYSIDYILDIYNLNPTRIVMPNSRRNEQIDFPLSVLGLSLLFPQDGSKGRIFVNSISIKDIPAAPSPRTLDYPLVPLADHWCIPADMPHRIPKNALLETAVNPVTTCRTLKISSDHSSRAASSSFGFAFAPLASPRGVLCPKLPRYDSAVATFLLTVLQPMPSIRSMTLGWMESNGGIYYQTIPLNLDKAGAHAIRVSLPAEVKAHQPYYNKAKGYLWVLGNIMFDTSESHGEQTVFLDAVDLEIARSPLEKLTMDLSSETGDCIIEPPVREKGVQARLTNRSSLPVTFFMEGQLCDLDGHCFPWMKKQQMTLKPSESVSLETIAVPQAYGLYKAEIILSAENLPTYTVSQSFAYMKLTGEARTRDSADGFLFGCIMHWDPYLHAFEEVDKAAKYLSQIGLNVLRGGISLHSHNPQALALQDHVIETFRKHGMQFDFIIGAERTDGKLDIEKTMKNYEQLFSKYKGKVKYWELLNEPDMYWGVPQKMTPEDYAELVRAAKMLLRKIDPQAKLLSAGFAFTGEGHKMVPFYHYNVMKILRNHFDIHCFHGHGTFEKFIHEQIDSGLIAMRQELGITTPWYANETALSSATGVTEKEQAMTGVKKTLFAWSRGAIGLNWYNYRSKGDLPGSGEFNYGMMTHDLHPKAVYVAFNAMIGLYRDKHFVQSLPMKEDHYGFVFASNDCQVVALWNELLPENVTLKTDASQAELYDMYGNRKPLAVSPEGLVTIQNTQMPQSVILYGASDVSLVEQDHSTVQPPDK